jgi:hypothetical protein
LAERLRATMQIYRYEFVNPEAGARQKFTVD